MIDLGIVKPGKTIRIPINTFDSNDPQASATVTGLAAADVEIYKDGSTTQRASDSGYTVTTDFDTTTGVQLIAIDLADNTTAGFYASGSEYIVVVGPFTLDAATINAAVARFEIGMPDADLNTTIATLASQTSFTLTAGPAENDALNGCVMYAHDVASSVQGGYAVVTDYVGSTKTVTLAAGPTFTMAATDNVHFYPPTNLSYVAGTSQTAGDIPALVTTVDTVVDGIQADLDNGTDGLGAIKTDTAAILTDTADMQPKLGTPAGASISADIATVDSNVDAILVDTGTDGVVLANNAISSAKVATNAFSNAVFTTEYFNAINAECDTALTDYDAATGTELAAVDTKIDTIDGIVDSILVDTASIGVTKNAAFSNLEFLMVDETDHVTPETGLTVTGTRSIDGGAFGAISGSIAEVGSGIYQVDLLAADTNGDVITYKFSATGAADRFITIKTRA